MFVAAAFAKVLVEEMSVWLNVFCSRDREGLGQAKEGSGRGRGTRRRHKRTQAIFPATGGQRLGSINPLPDFYRPAS